MKITKRIIVAMLSLVLVLSFSGCMTMKKPETEEEIKSDIEKMVDITAGKDYVGKVTIAMQSLESETQIATAFVDEFKKEYPNITVEVKPYASSVYLSSLKNIHSACMQKGNYADMPDVFWLTNETLSNFVNLDIPMPISMIEEVDESFTFDNLVETMIKDSSYDGKVYMMPRDYNQIVMYYNKAIFDLAGVAVPPQDMPQTQAEFVTMLRALKAGIAAPENNTKKNNNGVYYTNAMPVDAMWDWTSLTWPILKSFGGEIVNDKGEITFDSANNRKATEFIKELMNENLAAPAAKGHSTFIAELAPITFTSRAVMSGIISGENGLVHGVAEDLGVAPMPMLGEDMSNYSVGTGCSGYSMYRHADDATAAWLFLKFVVGEQAQNAFSATGNGVPVNELLLFDQNATWRNLDSIFPTLPADFNHDAFVYSYDKAACTLEDYKKYLPAAAVEDVATYIQECISGSLRNSTKDNYKTYIVDTFKTYTAKINNVLKQNA